jgi:hypothetical protein
VLCVAFFVFLLDFYQNTRCDLARAAPLHRPCLLLLAHVVDFHSLTDLSPSSAPDAIMFCVGWHATVSTTSVLRGKPRHAVSMPTCVCARVCVHVRVYEVLACDQGSGGMRVHKTQPHDTK